MLGRFRTILDGIMMRSFGTERAEEVIVTAGHANQVMFGHGKCRGLAMSLPVESDR